jgi:hypothetical protein
MHLCASLFEGRIIAPVSIGTYTADFVLLSDDDGVSWSLATNNTNTTSIGTWVGMDEAQATLLPNGSTLILMRHPAEPWAGKAAATSADGGKTWGPAVMPWGRPDVCPTCTSALVSPICQSSITSYLRRRRVLLRL